MDRDRVEVNEHAKKELGQYPAILTEQAWSIKDLLHGFRGNFSCGTRRVVPSGQDSSILPAWVANHSAEFDSTCPLMELAMSDTDLAGKRQVVPSRQDSSILPARVANLILINGLVKIINRCQ